MKKIQTLLAVLALSVFGNAYALDIPKKSRYDNRIQYVNFNPNDVTELRTKDGYVTVVSFSNDEETQDIAVGFKDGWEVKNSGYNIYIRPQAVKVGESFVEPKAGEWDTNLLVRTNKYNYVFDLKLVENKSHVESYFVKFDYPTEEARLKAEIEAASRAEQERQQAEARKQAEQKLLNRSLDNFTPPKNWDYTMKVGKNSREITPSFTYDDGVRTYIGFDNVASIPAVFYYQGEQEMMSNISTKMQGLYTVVVVHKTASRFILRSGDQVVGIINNGFGKNPSANVMTTNNDVMRAVK